MVTTIFSIKYHYILYNTVISITALPDSDTVPWYHQAMFLKGQLAKSYEISLQKVNVKEYAIPFIITKSIIYCFCLFIKIFIYHILAKLIINFNLFNNKSSLVLSLMGCMHSVIAHLNINYGALKFPIIVSITLHYRV